MMEFVSWDDDIPFPTVSGKSSKIPFCSSHHQPEKDNKEHILEDHVTWLMMIASYS
jgi:hypothetical protein